MNKKFNKKGFTLTELIVVIVIIGILAVVLIPTLTGYIRKANESAAEQEAQSYVTAYNSWLVEKGVLTEYQENDKFDEYCKEELNLDVTVATDDTAQIKLNVVNEEVDGFIYVTAKGDYKVTYFASAKEFKVEKIK